MNHLQDSSNSLLSPRLAGLALGALIALAVPACTIASEGASEQPTVAVASQPILESESGYGFFPGEEVYVFKSTSDPALIDRSACDGASFVPNIVSAGRMTSLQYRQSDGAVGNPLQGDIGVGTLCFRLQDPTFTPFGPPLLTRGKITVSGISATLEGQCSISKKDTPAVGVHLMTCNLPLVGPLPAGYKGGLLTTNSVLNVAGVPGVSSGSVIALHLYKE